MAKVIDTLTKGFRLNKNRPANTEPSPATPPPLSDLPQEPERLGWRIATFAAETLEPAPGVKTTSVAVWQAYVRWCRKGKCIPLAIGIFQNRFDSLADEVGIERFQNGAHVLYRDLGLKGT